MKNEPPIIHDARYEIDGGINPKENKRLSNQQSIRFLKNPKQLILPLTQASKSHNKILIGLDEQVIKEQALLESDISSFTPITHSGCNGRVIEMSKLDLGHRSGLPLPAARITNDSNEFDAFSDQETAAFENLAWRNTVPKVLIQRVFQAGIVGLGGAAFPTHIKLDTPSAKIHTLIVNGMECEPYITCDDRLMREQPKSILEGSLIAAKIVGARKILFGIEDNKPEAIEALSKSIHAYRLQANKTSSKTINISIVVAKTKYPSGGEKQIIQLLTGKQVPQGKYPAALGIVVQNVATLFAVNDAVSNGHAMTKRLVTLTGNLVPEPGNYWIPFGTPISHIIDSLDINQKNLSEVIFGGPLMGQHLSNFDIPTMKSTNCIIFNADTGDQKSTHQPCIRCGECEVVCPIRLLPQQLYWFAKNEQWDQLKEQNLVDCIECGACSYVCPSEIPLVGYYQYAKSELKHNRVKQHKSDIAKTRFENRQLRLQRIKQEREEKRRKSAEARKLAAKNNESDPDGKKSAIEAALKRVQNKKDKQS